MAKRAALDVHVVLEESHQDEFDTENPSGVEQDVIQAIWNGLEDDDFDVKSIEVKKTVIE